MKELMRLLSQLFGQDFSETDLSAITPENVANWDSMGHLHLAVSIQDAFGVSLTDEDMETMLGGAAAIAEVLEKYGVEL